MKRYLILLWMLTVVSPLCRAQSGSVDITSAGAVGDGATLNTKAIQRVIDRLSRDGGGIVRVPEGRFLTGPLVLKSHVNLQLAPGAVLLGSTNPYDYPFMRKVLDHTASSAGYIGGLIQAKGAHHIALSGEGTLDGQGRRLALAIDSLFYAGRLDTVYYNLRRKRPERRPGNILFTGCSDLSVTGITIKNSGFWVQTYRDCERLVIDSIRVESDAYWNNDGMDIVDCHNVRITHCFVNAADDGICLKSETAGRFNDSILIEDCTVRSSASAIKFGTASVGGFQHVTIKDIRVFDTFRSAIALESVDGGFLRDVLVDGIEAVNTGNPIFIRLGHRNADGPVGSLSDILIRNVRVQVPFGRPDLAYELRGPDLDFFHNPFPSSIAGLPGHPVRNVVLENIEITYPGGGNDGLAYMPLNRLSDVPEKPADYPEFSMFGELPAWGFYVRHAEGITFRNVYLKAARKDYRPACVLDDVRKIALDNIDVREAGSHKKQFILRNTNASITRTDKSQVSRIR